MTSTRQMVLEAWELAREEWRRQEGAVSGREYKRFRDAFIDAAAERWELQTGDVRRIITRR